MRWKLDDNERSAFHYLLGGLAVVLILKGAALLVSSAGTSPAEDAAVLQPFHQGYLLHAVPTVVATPFGAFERIVFAALFGAFCALVAALLALLIARTMKLDRYRIALRAARFTLVLALGWSLYAALFLPVRQAELIDHAIVLTQRKVFIRDVPVPFTAAVRTISVEEIARIEGTSQAPVHGCDGRADLVLVERNGNTVVLATKQSLCEGDELPALRAASDAALLLERDLH